MLNAAELSKAGNLAVSEAGLEAVAIPSLSLLVLWVLLHLVDLQLDLVEASVEASEVASKTELVVVAASGAVVVVVVASRIEEAMAAEVV